MGSIKRPSAVDFGIASELIKKGDEFGELKLPQGGVQIVNKDMASSNIHPDMNLDHGSDSEDSLESSNIVNNLESMAIAEGHEKAEYPGNASTSGAMEVLMARIREQEALIADQKNELISKNREVNNLRQALEPEPSHTGGKESRHLKESSSSRLNLSGNVSTFPRANVKGAMDENSLFALEPETENLHTSYQAGEPKAFQQTDHYNYMGSAYPTSEQGADDVGSDNATNRGGSSGGVISADNVDRTIHNLQGAFSGHSRPFANRGEPWSGFSPSPENAIVPAPGLQSGSDLNQGIWAPTRSHSNPNTAESLVANAYPLQSSAFYAQRFASKPHDSVLAGSSTNKKPGHQTAAQLEHYNYDWQAPDRYRPAQYDIHHSTTPTYPNPYSGQMPPPSSHYNRSIAESGAVPHPPGAIGTHLSPTAAEFRSNTSANSVWNPSPSTRSASASYPSYQDRSSSYRSTSGTDRSYYCNWNLMVEKIVNENDQQSSLFLQQRLKLGAQEQRHAIVDAIIERAYPLMINRFGNFLVQRCFEHGTPHQIEAIAIAMRGKTLQLSMDAFGCHVVQKAFDCVNESHKATMVHELLRRIPETVVHRYACHVWQKLFELRWVDSPPQIMKYVNEALKGMWPDVALGETGSLVVQNIFENCLEEDKRPCINEVLMSIELIARGQYGNWCIQHICEHGAPPDRAMAIDNVIMNATEYSMDQFASKVVEKCLKVAGPEFLDRYLDRVCEGRPDRPRIPLIDIASDQYGNYLVQHIIQTAAPHHREIVATHIRKHMVSLRGSKFGSRVGMLCSHQNFNKTTSHPAPPTSNTNHRYQSHGGGNGRWNYR